MKGSRVSLVGVLILLATFALVAAACAPVAAPAPAPTSAPTQPTSAPAQPTSAPAATAASATSAPPAGKQKITFQAGYLPQGNISFVAAYVAKEKGFFDQVGLDVTIDHTPPGQGDNFKRLAAKDIQFTTIPGPDIVKQVGDQGVPFVDVAVFGHASDNAIIALEKSGFKSLKDLEGKKVGYKFFINPWVKAMFEAAGADMSKVDFVSVGFDPRILLDSAGAGKVDAEEAFKSNEPDTLARAGFPVTVFKPEDLGVTSLGQTYITHQDYVKSDPEMIRKFLKATMKGLAYALDPANKNEVTDIVMKYAGADADRAHNEFIWTTEAGYVQNDATKQVGLGYASDDEWQKMIDILVKYKGVDNAPPVSKVWDPSFIKSIYQNGQLQFP